MGSGLIAIAVVAFLVSLLAWDAFRRYLANMRSDMRLKIREHDDAIEVLQDEMMRLKSLRSAAPTPRIKLRRSA